MNEIIYVALSTIKPSAQRAGYMLAIVVRTNG
jgi:hypothetical protein